MVNDETMHYCSDRANTRSSTISLTWRMVVLLLIAAILPLCAAPASATSSKELYRIRILNRRYGPVEVSCDRGSAYFRVGKVLHPAEESIMGYSASVYAEPGTVAATAVHGIRIKTAGSKNCREDETRVISILPREFATSPKGFGGHSAGLSGITTDISTGQSIFRNLAPLVGNSVYLQSSEHLSRLEDGYHPKDGDMLVIVVLAPERYPKCITIENKTGGAVEAEYPDGKETIARVERPVRGTGRFDATGYTGVGKINTNHTGVLTISTAPLADGDKDGSNAETRGGFMIQPSRHALESDEVSQVLVVGPAKPGDDWLEGSPPLFSGYIGLTDDPKTGNSFQVDVKTETSEWMPLPPIVGVHCDALSHLPNGAGAVERIRIRFPELSAGWIEQELHDYSIAYKKGCHDKALQKGTVVDSTGIDIQLPDSECDGVRFAKLYVDGDMVGISNNRPYGFTIRTRRLEEGEHSAEILGSDITGNVVKEVERTFYVQ